MGNLHPVATSELSHLSDVWSDELGSIVGDNLTGIEASSTRGKVFNFYRISSRDFAKSSK